MSLFQPITMDSSWPSAPFLHALDLTQYNAPVLKDVIIFIQKYFYNTPETHALPAHAFDLPTACKHRSTTGASQARDCYQASPPTSDNDCPSNNRRAASI